MYCVLGEFRGAEESAGVTDIPFSGGGSPAQDGHWNSEKQVLPELWVYRWTVRPN
ncbi:hypothetical protein BJ508DRAFT_414015 [Ascobolus immersus RN42]|uniref:Uncharacterized protein n=1 Tax=Ascobolus immersus RN42 TaxID=1160509 RepID=A0A3N4IEF7_ASCIM|nr:hypothetical protein BJ508DRAFT_414015 [Ascobolus immersus RN42]